MRGVLLMAAFAGLLCGQDRPELSGMTDTLGLNQAQCLARAEDSFRTLNLPYQGGQTWHSRGVQSNDYYVIIECLPINDRSTWSVTHVAGRTSTLNATAAMRDCLGELMRLGARGPICGGAATNSGNRQLLGSWRGCDGRTVQFTYENGLFVGRFTALGRLEGAFQINEVGYELRQTADGQYQGQVLWKSAGGANPRWQPGTITVSGNQYADTGADSCSQTMTRVAGGGTVVSAPTQQLLGAWRGCDGRTVQFTYENGLFVGRFTALGGLGAYGFQINEVGYQLRQTADGRYQGQVLWKSAGGANPRWQPGTITVSRNQYADTGSDSCSQTMTRVAGGGTVVGAPTQQLLGAWRGCDGRTVQFTYENGVFVGRYTALGGLGAYGFQINEIGYQLRQTADGTYQGQDLWKSAGGSPSWRAATITVTGSQYADTGADGCSQTMTRIAGGGTAVSAPTQQLLGSWRGCDGRTVQFTYENGLFVGRFTALGRLAGAFQINEVGYQLRQAPDGTYQGQVLWKSAGGANPRWQPGTITVSGNQYADTGSDSCSQTMTRVGR